MEGDQVTFLNDDTTIDLGAIAKGYIADEMKAYLEENGVKSAVINLGGDGLSTTCFALGLEKGRELIESMEGIYGVFITQDGGLHYTDGAEDFLYNE